MRSFNVVTGLPRSGSTLLCNVLNQNPDFWASSTSPVPMMVAALSNVISHSDEIRGLLERDDNTTARCTATAKAVVDAWYQDEDRHVFDKSRGWTFHALLLREMFPQAKIIATVRDLRNVFGSVEKQHRKNPIFDQGGNPNEKTILSRADSMLSPDGFIGQCVVGVMDLAARMPEAVHVVVYEKLASDPRHELRRLYEFLELEWFEHDLDNVENVATDADGLWLNKFPHSGHGQITPTDPDEWKNYVQEDLGGLIFDRWPDYNTRFGYRRAG